MSIPPAVHLSALETIISDRKNLYCVYVSDNSVGNFRIGIQKLIWGGKTPAKFLPLKRGDFVLFVSGLKSLNKAPGFPRVTLDKFNGVSKETVLARVTADAYEEHDTTVWPDDLYPYRFNFEIIDQAYNQTVNPMVIAPAVVDAIRKSASGQSLPTQVAWQGAVETGSPITEDFLTILKEYQQARGRRFSKDEAAMQAFESLFNSLKNTYEVSRHDKIRVKYSCGKGNWAEIPWISFLHADETETTQRGVYVVILFRSDMSGLYLTLAQGVTEVFEQSNSKAEGLNMLAENAIELGSEIAPLVQSNGFRVDSDVNLKSNAPLGQSYEKSVAGYKFYDREGIKDQNIFLNDLDRLLDVYSKYVEKKRMNERRLKVVKGNHEEVDLKAVYASFDKYLSEAGRTYGSNHGTLCRSFFVSALTKPFLILTGLSGSGKTQLAMSFGKWLAGENTLVLPVRPDWNGPESLFGYEDALQVLPNGKRAWCVPSALEFFINAHNNKDQPHVLILDEMNLAHVERYFADVLSGMESKEPCIPNVANEKSYWTRNDKGEPLIQVPENVIIIGTVNVDETTYMFSPKVLDRANTFEFRVNTEDLVLRPPHSGKPEQADGSIASAFLHHMNTTEAATKQTLSEDFANSLRRLHAILQEEGFEFGYRTFSDCMRFFNLYMDLGEGTIDSILDLQLIQKMLPRLHGSRRRLEPLLKKLGEISFMGKDFENLSADFQFQSLESEPLWPYSFSKLKRMHKSLVLNQFVSFTE